MEAQEQSLEKRDRKTVFIVEDDHHLLELYMMILNNKGWSILGTFDNGKVTQKEYQKLNEKPVVTILDFILPGCSGLDVAKKILEINPNQKILFVSGQIDLLSNDPVLKEFPRLLKPFSPESLIQKLSEPTLSLDRDP
jgi:two-component system LytT family response regulator